MGISVQIDVYADKMTNTQLGIFCLVGSIATLLTAYGLVLLTGRICRIQSKVFKACMYYTPEAVARIGYGVFLFYIFLLIPSLFPEITVYF